jgi:hypothetical protein
MNAKRCFINATGSFYQDSSEAVGFKGRAATARPGKTPAGT